MRNTFTVIFLLLHLAMPLFLVGQSASTSVDTLLARTQQWRYTRSDTALYLLNQIFERELTPGQKGRATELYGDIMWYQGNYEKSVEAYQQNVKLYTSMDSMRYVGHCHADIGYVYMEMKRYADALEQYQMAFELAKTYNDENLIYLTSTYKGQLNQSLGAPEKALESYREALSDDIKLNNKRNTAILYNNMGSVYLTMDQYEKAYESAQKSWEIWKTLDDKNGLANYYTNTGISLRFLDRYEEAEGNLLMAAKLNRELGKPIFLADDYMALADLYLAMGKAHKVGPLLDSVGKILATHQNLNLMADYYYARSDYYHWTNREDSAYYYLSKYNEVKDSILDEKKQEQITLLSAQFDSDKKEYDIKLLKAEHERDQLLIEQRNTQLLYTIGGGTVFLILSLIAYRSYRQKQRANDVISEQNEELNMQNEELAAQRDEIERQKAMVEEAHGEIQDSIIYAKRIQSAILPPDELIKSVFPESFVLYLPKDVVAGDFYWMEKVGDTMLFAVADCTGHGVPGAMVSVVCHNALNRSVREFSLTEPGKVLDKTRELVLSELLRSGQEIKDGMDIALCALNGNVLQYAGAFNPLWMMRSGELIEVRADRQPVGKTVEAKPFTTHKMKLQKDDVLYLFSDGYADQFGGTDDRKFGAKRMRALITSLADKEMTEQRAELEDKYNTWVRKGKSSQIDDICVLGMRFNHG